jgi:hypothetical protein
MAEPAIETYFDTAHELLLLPDNCNRNVKILRMASIADAGSAV